LGFGGALTEFSAYALSLIPPEKRKEAIDAFYSAETGNRYTLARTHLNSCDFSLENWACVEQADESLESFSLIEEQKKTRYRYLVEGAPRIGAWFPGERYAYNIINDLNHGCMAWIECVFNDFQYGAPYSLDGRVGNMVDCCAFKNTYGSVVLVLMNRSEGDMFYEVFAGGTTANLWCPPRGIQTLVMEG
jgi:O-glycosyl hydrolase